MNKALNRINSDSAAGVFTIFFSVFVFLHSLELSEGSGIYPAFVCVIMGIAGLILLFRGIGTSVNPKYFSGIDWKGVSLAVSLWILTIYLLQIIGFFVSSFIFVFILSWLISSKPKSTSDLVLLGSFAVGVCLVYWFIFSFILDISIPEGLLI